MRGENTTRQATIAKLKVSVSTRVRAGAKTPALSLSRPEPVLQPDFAQVLPIGARSANTICDGIAVKSALDRLPQSS